VCRVPPGRVTTYGTVGFLAGCPARVVGYALHHLPKTTHEVPWQRVINARGGISTYGDEQRRLLEAEGIVFDDRGLVDLMRWGWQPQITTIEPADEPAGVMGALR
jgi:methylated-DNA-protein-cysteine methyltransferase-like protein